MLYNENMERIYEKYRDNCGHVSFTITEGCPPHFHQHVELLAVMDGEIDVTINETARRLVKGEICISDSFDIHAYTPCDKTAVGYVLIVPTRFLAQYRSALKGGTLFTHFIRETAVFENVKILLCLLQDLLGIEGASGASNRPDDMLAASLAQAVLGYMAPALSYGSAGRTAEQLDVIRGVLSYLTEHFDEEITLADLSMRFGYTPNHFSYLFNRFLRCNLNEYLGDIRAENAARLLTTGVSTYEAAFASGFNSMRTFYRCFEKHFSMSPNRFVKNQANPQSLSEPDRKSIPVRTMRTKKVSDIKISGLD